MCKFPHVGFILLSLSLLQAGQTLQATEQMDVFGVAPGSVTELERCFGEAARELVAASPPRSRELEEKLELRIKEAGGFQAVDISITRYSESSFPFVLTFNLEVAGKGAPIKLLPEPDQDVPDPDGLLASWWEYEKIASATVGFAQAEPSCPAHHCTYGFDHPKLHPFIEMFARKVPAKRDELVEVLQADKDAKKRIAAAYLLAHLPSAQQVAEALLPRLRDPSPSVRNSVLRVLAYMADHGAAGPIPVEPILPFLSSQVATDRNKAVAIVAGLAPDKRYRTPLIGRAGCNLVRLLEMKQPNQSDWAHRALVSLRGEDLGASNPAAWKEWLGTQGAACQQDLEIGAGKLCPLSPAAKP